MGLIIKKHSKTSVDRKFRGKRIRKRFDADQKGERCLGLRRVFCFLLDVTSVADFRGLECVYRLTL